MALAPLARRKRSVTVMAVVHHSRTPWMPYAAGGAVLPATGAASVGAPFPGVEGFGGQSLLIFRGPAPTVWLTAFALHTRRLHAESQAPHPPWSPPTPRRTGPRAAPARTGPSPGR